LVTRHGERVWIGKKKGETMKGWRGTATKYVLSFLNKMRKKGEQRGIFLESYRQKKGNQESLGGNQILAKGIGPAKKTVEGNAKTRVARTQNAPEGVGLLKKEPKKMVSHSENRGWARVRNRTPGARHGGGVFQRGRGNGHKKQKRDRKHHWCEIPKAIWEGKR